MNNYSFATINDKDFEVLALDLLNEEYGLELQDFKVGKDKGIDLRYSTSKNDNSIVVQAKHYLKSDYKALLRSLHKELKNVKTLNPDRYIIVTSQELSPQNKTEIKQIFSPFIKTSNDVFGSQDFNRLLRRHKEIEKKHFKLWFSSTEIISNILNNAIEGRTRSYLERVKAKIPFYVLTKNFDEANKILTKEKVLVIAGQPGVGKTTLAEILLFEKAKTKSKIYLVNTIREAEDVISINPKEKQVFYFDDFLGEVYYEIIAGSQKESEISNFVDRIKLEPNKFLILSTRTVILEQARAKSEKIKRSKIDTGKYEIVLGSYTNLEKARILYNHLFFQNLNKRYLETIVEDRFYLWIITHKNYTPRIIDFITNKSKISSFSKFEYKEFVKKNIIHPEEIWHDSYLNQIEYLDRTLLQTIFTFQRGISEETLRSAFEARLDFEKKNNNKQISAEQFNKSVKNLLNGFIVTSIVNVDKNIKNFNFINPSISDFLIGYLTKNYSIKKSIIRAIVFLEQLEIFDPEKDTFKFEYELQEIVLKNIIEDKYDSIDQYKAYSFVGYKIEILIRFCKEIDIDDALVSLLNKINLNHIWWSRKGFELALENIEKCPKSKNYLKVNFESFAENYLEHIDTHEKALKVPLFFRKFGKDFNKFMEEEAYQKKFINLITKLANEKEKQLMQSYGEDIEGWDDYDNFVYEEVRRLESVLLYKFLPKEMSVEIPNHFDRDQLEEQILKNKINRKDALTREQERNTFYEEIVKKSALENDKINDLFSSIK